MFYINIIIIFCFKHRNYLISKKSNRFFRFFFFTGLKCFTNSNFNLVFIKRD